MFLFKDERTNTNFLIELDFLFTLGHSKLYKGKYF